MCNPTTLALARTADEERVGSGQTTTSFLPAPPPSSDVVVTSSLDSSNGEPCARFGEGGLDFFAPDNYAKWAHCFNKQLLRAPPHEWRHTEYAATPGEARPIHVLFEASAKTELGAAFGLMKSLAKDEKKYKVGRLSGGLFCTASAGRIFRERKGVAQSGKGEEQ